MGERVNSPFKFLDSFTLEDQDVFFGRDKEVETLYEYINMNKLVLVYGASGTGKTSLVQCGLAGRFDITDWYPLYIRRQGNILDAFEQELRKAAKSSYREDWVETLRRMNARYLRPTYLIFDQFEELLILGDEATEVLPFIDRLTAILEADDLGCHILLILREEYIARLYQFEKSIPTLFNRRLRVEPMSLALVGEVIRRSCDEFNISFEDPKANVQQIIDTLSAGRSGIALPYLQVYLDMLYREDYKTTYVDEAPEKPLPELEFTSAEIAAFGEIDDILERFLREQTDELQAEIGTLAPGVSEDLIQQVLDSFVTEEGTKKVLPFQLVNDEIKLDRSAPDYLLALESKLLTLTLKGLESRRILRANEQVYELAHDSLANLIDKNRSDEQRQLNEIKKRIKNGYAEYLRSGVFFTERQLLSIEEYLPKLELPESHRAFLLKSKEYVKQQKLAEEQARQEKLLLAEQKLAAEQKARRRQQIIFFTITLAVVLVSGIGYLAQQLNQKNVVLVLQEINSEIEAAHTLKIEGEYSTAVQALTDAEDLVYSSKLENEIGATLDTIDQRIDNYRAIQELVEEADSLSTSLSGSEAYVDTSKVKALELYKSANEIDGDVNLEGRIKNLAENISARAEYWYDVAETRAQTGSGSKQKEETLDALRIAIKLDSTQKERKRSIENQIEANPKFSQ